MPSLDHPHPDRRRTGALSLAFLLPLGDATNGRTQSRTAADAAALAAAEAWKADVVSTFEAAISAPGEGNAYGLLAQLLGAPSPTSGGARALRHGCSPPATRAR